MRNLGLTIMMVWHEIAAHSLPGEGRIVKVKVGGKSVCLINDQGTYYATSWRCPHAGADLSKGWCEDGRIICPYHRYAFNLATGRGDQGQGNYIDSYPVEKRDGKWCVGRKSSWVKRLFGGT